MRRFGPCGTLQLRAFLAYVSTGHEQAGGRWGNPQMQRAVLRRSVHVYFGNLRTLFRFIRAESELDDCNRWQDRRRNLPRPQSDWWLRTVRGALNRTALAANPFGAE